MVLEKLERESGARLEAVRAFLRDRFPDDRVYGPVLDPPRFSYFFSLNREGHHERKLLVASDFLDHPTEAIPTLLDQFGVTPYLRQVRPDEIVLVAPDRARIDKDKRAG